MSVLPLSELALGPEMPPLADRPELIGFFSYSREDDEAFGGTLSELHQTIQHELGAQLGRPKAAFRLWQDQVAIAPGKLWDAEIKAAIDQSVFFIPIVTPRFVASQYCKHELELFLTREDAVGRIGLIFPILYISVHALEDSAKLQDSLVLSTIARRQYLDWRPLRHLDIRATAVRSQIERFCGRIVEALQEPPEYRIRATEKIEPGQDAPSAKLALALPNRPSIAVLPFQNMSGDPEQDYFADGMVEDIITALSRIRLLFVIARNSSFTYKGRAVDVKQVGRELGVRYVLEGSVRKVAQRMRITGQLIDATTGAHLWADHFDGALSDVFDLQDQVTTSVVAAIAPKVEQAEIGRSKRKPTDSLDAYDYYLRGIDNVHLQTQVSTSEALRLFHKAIDLDSEFAAAHANAAFCYSQRKAFGWVENRAQEIFEAEPLARRAVEIGKDDALTLSRAGLVLAYVVEDFVAGPLLIDRACTLNSNLSSVWHASGWLRIWIGDPETAIEHLQRFVRISPLDPLLHSVRSAIAFAHVFCGRYAEAISYAEQALGDGPNSHQALRAAALSNAFAGHPEKARRMIRRLLDIDPRFCVSKLLDLTPLQRTQDIERYQEGMRISGLPE